MASVDSAAFSVATVAITTSVGAFYQLLPPVTEIRKKSADDPEFAADVRMGEIAAALIALGVGAAFSSLSGSSVPVLASLAISGGLIFMYESILNGKHLFSGVSHA